MSLVRVHILISEQRQLPSPPDPSAPNYLGTHRCNHRYPDTKHNLVSFTISALKEVEVTAALELLHGMYYSDFDSMLQDVGELFIFTPGRSDYKPLEPSRKSFFFVLDKDDFADLQVYMIASHVKSVVFLPNTLNKRVATYTFDRTVSKSAEMTQAIKKSARLSK